MIGLYMKQAWALIKQERLFSTVYIVGTGLAISLVMVLSIVLYVKFAPLYPDLNRGRELVWKYGVYKKADGDGVSSSALSYALLERAYEGIEELEAVAVYHSFDHEDFVQPADRPTQLPVAVQKTNADYWRVYAFRFLSGKPFGEEEFQSGLPVAVITERLARKLFGSEPAVGQEVSLHFKTYRVVGVVEAASPFISNCYADIYVPFTVDPEWNRAWRQPGLGPYSSVVLVKEGASKEVVKRKVAERIAQFDRELQPEGSFETQGAPDPFWVSVFRIYSNLPPEVGPELMRYGLVFLLLLLIPAVSLSGMADSRMNRRMAELGVRRAFGAPRTTLFGQILTENLLYTLLGGALGLLVSFGLVQWVRSWIFFSNWTSVTTTDVSAMVLPTGSLLNPWVFLIALAVCFVLNLLSAMIPAWRASRRPIVESLNLK
ncbi:MAG: ABC transporter permease [Parabacteroides sp.]